MEDLFFRDSSAGLDVDPDLTQILISNIALPGEAEAQIHRRRST